MRQIADLHIHSRYSRACSKALTLENLDKTCRIKGVDIIATGDFTFPDWIRDIKKKLVLAPSPASRERGTSESGLYILKSAEDDKVKFILSTELALIYKKFDKVRRIHIVVQAPNIEAVLELNNYLDKKYNIRSDGRPILGMSAEELVKLCLSIRPRFLIYPAHIWTPWFAVFGSKSGFDSMEECFGEYTKDIYAYETGLSSDPEMNWRLSALDDLTMLSNSDAHSLPNIAREANVFELAEVTYNEIYDVISHQESRPILRPGSSRFDSGRAGRANAAHTNIKEKRTKPELSSGVGSYLDYTIEFYPEEGMYHYDGHRDCGVRFTPEESKKHKGICPKCKKPLVIGVMNRVGELADRRPFVKALEGKGADDSVILKKPKGKPGFKKLVELDKIIAEAIGIKSRASKKVQEEYKSLVTKVGTEMKILLDEPIDNIKKATLPIIAEGIRRVREGELIIEPGFDGQYGTVKIFKDGERGEDGQRSLF